MLDNNNELSVVIITISDLYDEEAERIRSELLLRNIKSNYNKSSLKASQKIRDAQELKYTHVLMISDSGITITEKGIDKNITYHNCTLDFFKEDSGLKGNDEICCSV